MANALIHLDALVQNYLQLKALAPDSKTLAVIKADAYGHGLLPVAQALEPCADALAVARLEEALSLREAGIQNDILILEGFYDARELQSAINHQFKVVLHDLSQIELLSSLENQEQNLTVWLKVNTGMNRLGFSLDQLDTVCQKIKALPWLKAETLMTHFANADSGKPKDVETPLKIFEDAKHLVSELLPEISQYSLANSAALIAYPETHAQWNRPGISLYGGNTLPESFFQKIKTEVPLKLLPVMTLSAPIIAIHQVKKGEAVGYGSTWISEKDTWIAVIGIGYGDGYPRHAQNGTPVSIKGNVYPLAGRVSMDMITVNLGNNSDTLKVGDEAILWGKNRQ